MVPADPKIIEAVILACLEPDPADFRRVDEVEVKRAKTAIKRATAEKCALLKFPIGRKHFLCGCLDFTDCLGEEHLLVGYGYRYANGTTIERIHHVVGEQRRVSVSSHIRAEIRGHHFHRSDAEVIVFHNHPRIGNEAEWFYTLKSLVQDLPIASNDDRKELQHHALQPRRLVPAVLRAGPGSLLSRRERFCERVPAPAAPTISGSIEPAECSATGSEVTCRHNL